MKKTSKKTTDNNEVKKLTPEQKEKLRAKKLKLREAAKKKAAALKEKKQKAAAKKKLRAQKKRENAKKLRELKKQRKIKKMEKKRARAAKLKEIKAKKAEAKKLKLAAKRAKANELKAKERAKKAELKAKAKTEKTKTTKTEDPIDIAAVQLKSLNKLCKKFSGKKSWIENETERNAFITKLTNAGFEVVTDNGSMYVYASVGKQPKQNATVKVVPVTKKAVSVAEPEVEQPAPEAAPEADPVGQPEPFEETAAADENTLSKTVEIPAGDIYGDEPTDEELKEIARQEELGELSGDIDIEPEDDQYDNQCDETVSGVSDEQAEYRHEFFNNAEANGDYD